MNKPVAWMDYLEHSDMYDLNVSGRGIPLYTHPPAQQWTIEAKFKELTDEEILQVMMNVYSDTVPPIRGIEFAKAILRKAQENG